MSQRYDEGGNWLEEINHKDYVLGGQGYTLFQISSLFCLFLKKKKSSISFLMGRDQPVYIECMHVEVMHTLYESVPLFLM